MKIDEFLEIDFFSVLCKLCATLRGIQKIQLAPLSSRSSNLIIKWCWTIIKRTQIALECDW